ncbi:acyl-CoA N-acyltransferase [Trametes polyzona]|nr:acyl-CoA N-acyltransferase [Trametes polyzona]
MSETPTVREATPADLPQIVPLLLASLDTSIPGVTFSDSPANEPSIVHEKMRARLFPPNSLKVYVLELPSTGEIVAYGNVKPRPSPADGENADAESGGGVHLDQDELDMFFVKFGMGGRGYGGQLLAAIQREWARRGGLQLHVFKKNERAIRFYEKMGFRLIPGGEVVWDLDLKEGRRKETACLMSWPGSVSS